MVTPKWKMQYRSSPVLAVDAVIYDSENGVVFVRRRHSPFQGYWALPGGIVEHGETVESALIREVKEETGLDVELQELVGVFSDPSRDPRGHVVSIVFHAVLLGGTLQANSDALDVKWFSTPPKQLAFDHQIILDASRAFLRGEDRKTG
jgi:8-oxo-dGTP diphosphatase